MRKRLTLSISIDKRFYGVDEKGIAVLTPDDFRKTVINSIENGDFKDGDIFEIDVNKEGEPIRRSIDSTIAVHRPVEKKYSREDFITLLNKALTIIESGKTVDIDLLLPKE